MFESEGAVAQDLRKSFAASLESTESDAENVSRLSRVELPEIETWVESPLESGLHSSGAQPPIA
jgi:hypothetical protein